MPRSDQPEKEPIENLQNLDVNKRAGKFASEFIKRICENPGLFKKALEQGKKFAQRNGCGSLALGVESLNTRINSRANEKLYEMKDSLTDGAAEKAKDQTNLTEKRQELEALCKEKQNAFIAQIKSKLAQGADSKASTAISQAAAELVYLTDLKGKLNNSESRLNDTPSSTPNVRERTAVNEMLPQQKTVKPANPHQPPDPKAKGK